MIADMIVHPYFIIGVVFGTLVMGLMHFIQSAILGRGVFSRQKYVMSLSDKLQDSDIIAFIPHSLKTKELAIRSSLTEDEANVLLVDRVIVFNKQGELLNQLTPLTQIADLNRNKVQIGKHRAQGNGLV
ncbi:hypothetical protein [Marinobacter sp. MBR-105]|jgi:hypothetical protein